MQIGGIQRFSSIDFPGRIASVLFTVGCNFRCPFCHNPELVVGPFPSIPEDIIFAFLKSRVGQLDGVVISGGEPTLHHDLTEFITKIKDLGFEIKLDTNGTNPTVLQELLNKNVLDYVAIDIKHTWEKYNTITRVNLDVESIKKSVNILINSNIEYEFRTTVIQSIHTLDDIVEISENIRGAKVYAVQEFIPTKTLDENFSKYTAFDKNDFENIRKKIEGNVEKFIIRA